MSGHLIIDGVEIDDDSDCYVIAEVGHNHQGSLKTCMSLFAAAKEAGAHAVKLQKRDNLGLYTKAGREQAYENPNSYGATYYAHREALEFGRREYVELQGYAKELGVTFFATAFDLKSADFLAALDMPAYKIASGDIVNTPLLEHVASFGKPMIVSTGGASQEDIQRAVDTICPINQRLALLQCTAGYPPAFDELDLRVIESLRRCYPDIVAGFSSHDSGIAMAVAAYVLGARIVEKHFTLNRAWKGTDHGFSLERPGMRRLVRDLRRVRVALGSGEKHRYESEEGPLTKMAKKLVAARDLDAGHVLTAADIAFKSPGDGLPPYEIDNVLGRELTAAVGEDEAITLAALSGNSP